MSLKVINTYQHTMHAQIHSTDAYKGAPRDCEENTPMRGILIPVHSVQQH